MSFGDLLQLVLQLHGDSILDGKGVVIRHFFRQFFFKKKI
jgi:hypothetical protein